MSKYCEKCGEPVYMIYDYSDDVVEIRYHCYDEYDWSDRYDNPDHHCNHVSLTCLTESQLKRRKLNKKLKKIDDCCCKK